MRRREVEAEGRKEEDTKKKKKTKSDAVKKEKRASESSEQTFLLSRPTQPLSPFSWRRDTF